MVAISFAASKRSFISAALAVALIGSAVLVDAHDAAAASSPLARRDAAFHHHGRVIKKRADAAAAPAAQQNGAAPAGGQQQDNSDAFAGIFGGGGSAGGAGGANSVAPAPPANTPTTPAITPTASPSPSPSVSSSAPPNDPLGSLIGGVATVLGLAPKNSSSSTSSMSSTSASTTSHSTTSTTSTSSTSSTPTPTPSPVAEAPSISIAVAVVSSTTTLSPSQSAVQAAQAAAALGAKQVQRNTIIALCAIGGSIAAIAVLFTLFRKWRFSKSSRFDDRVQPIHWDPSVDGNIDDDLPGSVRRRQSNASSFFSADHHTRGGAQSPEQAEQEMSQQAQARGVALPAHDFTAGSADHGMSSVGDYADLSRGNSLNGGHGGNQNHIYFNDNNRY